MDARPASAHERTLPPRCRPRAVHQGWVRNYVGVLSSPVRSICSALRHLQSLSASGPRKHSCRDDFSLLDSATAENRKLIYDQVRSLPMQSGQNAPQDPKGRDSTPGTRNQIPFNLYFWWLIFAGLMIWNLFTLWPRQHTIADIPYSTF